MRSFLAIRGRYTALHYVFNTLSSNTWSFNWIKMHFIKINNIFYQNTLFNFKVAKIDKKLSNLATYSQHTMGGQIWQFSVKWAHLTINCQIWPLSNCQIQSQCVVRFDSNLSNLATKNEISGHRFPVLFLLQRFKFLDSY